MKCISERRSYLFPLRSSVGQLVHAVLLTTQHSTPLPERITPYFFRVSYIVYEKKSQPFTGLRNIPRSYFPGSVFHTLLNNTFLDSIQPEPRHNRVQGSRQHADSIHPRVTVLRHLVSAASFQTPLRYERGDAKPLKHTTLLALIGVAVILPLQPRSAPPPFSIVVTAASPCEQFPSFPGLTHVEAKNLKLTWPGFAPSTFFSIIENDTRSCVNLSYFCVMRTCGEKGEPAHRRLPNCWGMRNSVRSQSPFFLQKRARKDQPYGKT